MDYDDILINNLFGLGALTIPTSLKVYPCLNSSYSKGAVMTTPTTIGDSLFNPLTITNGNLSWYSSSPGYVANAYDFIFSPAAVDWGNVRYALFLTTAGDVYAITVLGSPTLILAGQILRFNAGTLKIGVKRL